MATILFGGSFDPIHNGHLAMIRAALSRYPHDTVLLLPAAHSPFKPDGQAAPAPHRLAMCRLAAGDPRVEVSDLELTMPKPSYTVRTVERLLAARPDTYRFLCGADTFLTVHTWREYDRLVRLVTWLPVARGGADDAAMNAQKERIEADGGQVERLFMPPWDVSSTAVRRAVRNGEPVDRLVPPAVERYIQENHLYRE